MGFSLGKLVFVKSGKNTGKPCVVVGQDLKSGTWLVANGTSIPVSRPKKKNPRHLRQTRIILEAVAERINREQPLDNGWLNAQILSSEFTQGVFDKEGNGLYGKR